VRRSIFSPQLSISFKEGYPVALLFIFMEKTAVSARKTNLSA
jgi:hypothetical protein